MLTLLFCLASIGAAHDELVTAMALVDSDRSKLAEDTAALEVIFHRLYPVPVNPQPVPVDPIVAHKIEIIMVGGEGCAPCIKMRPIIAELAKEGVVVTEISADSPGGQVWAVAATPTFITVLDGKELVRAVGVLTEKQLRTWWADTNAWVARKYPK